MKVRLTVVVICLCAFSLAGQPFKNPQAEKARQKLDGAVQQAQANYLEAIEAGKRQYQKDLGDAIKVVMKSGNLEEANRLDEERKQVEGELKGFKKPPGIHAHVYTEPRIFEISATGQWQRTIEVKRGTIVKFKATGKWSLDRRLRNMEVGPEGRNCDNILVGRIAEGPTFLIGSKAEVFADRDGLIELGPGMIPDIAYHPDDAGSVTVEISVPGARNAEQGLAGKHPEDAVEFNGHWYKFVKEPAIWDEAQRQCEEAGGYLVCVETPEEANFLLNFLKLPNQLLWIGLTDDDQEGNWKWVTGQRLGIPMWSSTGEPSNSLEGENKVEFGRSSQNRPVWNDRSGDARRPYVCEWEQ